MATPLQPPPRKGGRTQKKRKEKKKKNPSRHAPMWPHPAGPPCPSGFRSRNPTVRAGSGKRHKRFFVGDFLFAKSDCPSRFHQSIKTRNRRRTHRRTHTHVVIIYKIVDSILLKGFIQIGTLSTETIHQHCLSKL